MEKIIRRIPDDVNERFTAALNAQKHLGSQNAFLLACMEALIKAHEAGRIVPAPLEFITR